MDVSIQLYSTAAGARWTGGWVGPTEGLEFEMPKRERLFDSSQAYNRRPTLTKLFRLPLGSYIAHFTLWKRCPFTSGHSWGNFSAQSGHKHPYVHLCHYSCHKRVCNLIRMDRIALWRQLVTTMSRITHITTAIEEVFPFRTRNLNAFGHLRRHGQSRIPA